MILGKCKTALIVHLLLLQFKWLIAKVAFVANCTKGISPGFPRFRGMVHMCTKTRSE